MRRVPTRDHAPDLCARIAAVFDGDHRNNLVAWESEARTLRFHHDALDQLVHIDGLERPWTAEYDPLGRRIRKTYGAEVTEYLWDTDRLAAELLPGGRLRVYVYLDDFAFTPWLLIDYDDVDADPASGRLHTLVSDQRGAPVLALDADGNRVWSATLAPYGLAETEGDLDIRHRLAGQLVDPETGLHYNRFRYYSPVLGRYLEEDPAGVGGGLNLYGHTYNPYTSTDSRGLMCETPDDPSTREDHPPQRRPERESGHDRMVRGARREERVAAMVGGSVSREVVVTRVGRTDLDVVGPGGELIAVGGPAKAKDLGKLGTQLKKLRLLAEERNVRAQAFFEEGTPQSALEFTARRLGPENVFIFNETGYYPFSPGVP